MAFAAQAADGAAPAGKDAQSEGGPQQMILFIAVMLVVMYLVVLRPQKRERKEREQRLNSMKKGDKIITIGGMHGKIADVDHVQNIVSVEVCSNPRAIVRFSKAAIQTVASKGAEKDDVKQGSGGDKTEPAQE